MDLDWQNNLIEIRERGQFLLQSEKWSDCRFLVGATPNVKLIAGHKLLLAMASPVFERMFFGNLPDETDPIVIPDMQPEAFLAMLEYIYTDRINIASFDKACELCYVAKKYMLPHVVERCTHFLWADLSPKNACRAYEFAKLFDEPRLMQSSMELIAANTREVLTDPSFTDIEMSTLMAILDQNRLNIDSELDLFNCLLKFGSERGMFTDGDGDKQLINNDDGNAPMPVEEIKMEPDVAAMMHNHVDNDDDNVDVYDNVDDFNLVDNPIVQPTTSNNSATDEVVVVDNDTSVADHDVSVGSASSTSESATVMFNKLMMLRQAVKKIRFLTLTPQQFAEGPARSQLLQQHEALAILIKISSPTINDCPMPEGFCISRSSRNFYESHRQRDLASYRHPAPSNNATAATGFAGSSGGNGVVDASTNHAQGLFCSPSTAPAPAIAVTSASTTTAAAIGAVPAPIVVNANQLQCYNGSETDLATNDTRRSYCVRTLNQQFDYRNTSVTDCGVTFQVDTNIWITGVQVPTQVLCGELMNSAGFSERYTEILYAHIQDMQGSRITYTHCTSRVRYDSLLDITFDRPVYIYRNQIYKVYVVFNKVGWYPMYTCVPDVICNRVKFMFNVGNPSESVRDGLIRSIIFSTPQDHHTRSMIE